MDTVRASLAFIDGLGTPEMILIFVIVLVLFGGQKLPEFARGLGKSIRQFKKAAAGVEEEFKRALDEDERKHLTPKIAAPATAALATATSAHSDAAGPEAIVHDYDEYGHEITPADHTPAEPVAPASAVDPHAPGSTPALEPAGTPPPSANPAAAQPLPEALPAPLPAGVAPAASPPVSPPAAADPGAPIAPIPRPAVSSPPASPTPPPSEHL